MFRGNYGWNPKHTPASTVNKDADRFERKSNGTYHTLADSGYSNNDRPSSERGKIKVKNFKYGVDISISKWHESENGSNFYLGRGQSDSWGRSTARGNIMAVDNRYKYYVKPGEAVSVFHTGGKVEVFIDGKKAKEMPTV